MAPLAMVDAVPAKKVDDVDIFATPVVISCKAAINTLTDSGANLLLSSLCTSVEAIGATAGSYITGVFASRVVPTALDFDNVTRQVAAGVKLELMFPVNKAETPGLIARLTIVVGPSDCSASPCFPVPVSSGRFRIFPPPASPFSLPRVTARHRRLRHWYSTLFTFWYSTTETLNCRP
jgi:hypothetical protein